MGNLTQHFDESEFRCPCCGKLVHDVTLSKRLEQLHKALNAKAIIITSGYRCPSHSVAVGGYANDAHVQGFAADVVAYKKSGSPYTAETVAREAEKLGFGGIGIISNDAVHLDIRDMHPEYPNMHWFGDERTHNDNIATFQKMGEPIEEDEPETKKHVIELFIDGVSVYRKESDV